MDDFIIQDPTVVNARELYKNNYDIVYKVIEFLEYSNEFETVPDGTYSLYYFGDEDPNPSYFLYNSDEKWTGIIMSLRIKKKSGKEYVRLTLPKDFRAYPKFKFISKKGKAEILETKKISVSIVLTQRLVSLFSRKLNKKIKFTEYPLYTSSQEEISKSKGIVVSGDTNQPIKGATIEKTD
jgi:hypothetical protein